MTHELFSLEVWIVCKPWPSQQFSVWICYFQPQMKALLTRHVYNTDMRLDYPSNRLVGVSTVRGIALRCMVSFVPFAGNVLCKLTLHIQGDVTTRTVKFSTRCAVIWEVLTGTLWSRWLEIPCIIIRSLPVASPAKWPLESWKCKFQLHCLQLWYSNTDMS